MKATKLLVLVLCVVISEFLSVNAGSGVSDAVAAKLSSVINKLQSLKRMETQILANSSSVAEAREPSSGYGHGGGGGYGHGSGGGYGHGGGGGYGHGGGGGYGHGGGGYGHGGGGGHGHGGGGHGKAYGGGGHGAITLDPVSIISLLALGAFLINNILQLLRANSMTMASGRSLDVSDLNVPLELSDVAMQTRELLEDTTEGPSFAQFFKNVGSLYYLNPKKRNLCIKKVVCSYATAQKRDDQAPSTFKTKIFDIMLTTITTLVAPELNGQDESSSPCDKFNKLCSDTVLRDAKITAENKIYGHVSSLISKFALSQLLSG